MPDDAAVAERIEQQITQRFIAALGVWQQQQLEEGYGTIKIDSADLITPALAEARRAGKREGLKEAQDYIESHCRHPEGGCFHTVFAQEFHRRSHALESDDASRASVD